MPHFHLWHGPSLLFVCYHGRIFLTFSLTCPGFSTDNMPLFFIKMCHIANFWHPLHFSVLPNCQLSAPAMASQHKTISGRKGKGSILTHHVCPVCSKDFISSQSLACHLTSVPYCCQSWLSVSNGLQIDYIVLPTNALSLCWDFGDHSPDDADDDYHPIYATSIDGQDELASNNDNLVWTNDVMEENSGSDSHTEPPSDVDECDFVGNTSPYISHPVFPSVQPSSPCKDNNGFIFLPSKTFPENVEDLCFLELAKLIHEIGAPLSAFSKILAWVGHWQMEGHTFKTAAFPSYMMYVESLSKRLELDCLKYEMETIIAHSGGPCTFPVFDFPLIHQMTTPWATPITLMPNLLRSFIIYLRYYFALRPGTSWMQFQRKTLTVVGLAAPFGLPLKKWWQLLIGRRVWVWSLQRSIVPLTLTTTLLHLGPTRTQIWVPVNLGIKNT